MRCRNQLGTIELVFTTSLQLTKQCLDISKIKTKKKIQLDFIPIVTLISMQVPIIIIFAYICSPKIFFTFKLDKKGQTFWTTIKMFNFTIRNLASIRILLRFKHKNNSYYLVWIKDRTLQNLLLLFKNVWKWVVSAANYYYLIYLFDFSTLCGRKVGLNIP